MPTPRGKTRWCASTVRSILRNEKYKGDALLQKTITLDFLSKTVKKNEGEVTQYYVTGHHPPIIDPDVWNAFKPNSHNAPSRIQTRTTYSLPKSDADNVREALDGKSGTLGQNMNASFGVATTNTKASTLAVAHHMLLTNKYGRPSHTH